MKKTLYKNLFLLILVTTAAGGYARLAGEDEEGEGFVAKYRTEMPK